MRQLPRSPLAGSPLQVNLLSSQQPRKTSPGRGPDCIPVGIALSDSSPPKAAIPGRSGLLHGWGSPSLLGQHWREPSLPAQERVSAV